jgi:hypothetical protein
MTVGTAPDPRVSQIGPGRTAAAVVVPGLLAPAYHRARAFSQ